MSYQAYLQFTPGRVAALLLIALIGCHPAQPVFRTPQPRAEGTVVGRVVRIPGHDPVVGRVVVAKRIGDGETTETRTSEGGGFLFQLPPGRYKFDLKFELRDVVVQRPSEVALGPSEVVDNLDFVIRSELASKSER